MSGIRTFPGVTPDTLSRMQELGRASYGIVYNPPVGSAGTATSQTPLGQIVIEFVHNNENSELTLTLIEKPPLLPEKLLWSGFVNTLNSCRELSSQCSTHRDSSPAAGAADHSPVKKEGPEHQSNKGSSRRLDIDAANNSPTNADPGEFAKRSVSATQDTAEMPSEYGANVDQSENAAGPKTLDAISRMTYTGSYALAYGVVYATMFIVRSLPQDNPIMNGLYDGGRAAVNELNGG